ncbi:hypothetical protein B0H16DRAFT_1474300 [Mycena metata]|uniref:F-box domain-containing protein n=1 Tax=Mycena metata TaxID=1033252 RepID=A0AAD7MJY5_9AGAR|nr:hypothetical protein B0H16DRAFT_1474300 [Mycena metata]
MKSSTRLWGRQWVVTDCIVGLERTSCTFVDAGGELFNAHQSSGPISMRGPVRRWRFTSITEESSRQSLFRRLPALRTFNLVRAGRTMPRDTAPRMLTWAGGHTNASSLRLHYTSLAWSRMPKLASLTVLVIRDLIPELSPTWSDYQLLFQTAGQLRKLSIRNVGCREIPSFQEYFAELRWLDHLDLRFGADCTFASVLSHMRLPALTDMKFSSASDEEVEVLGSHASALASVSTFVFGGVLADPSSMLFVFLNLPSLENLDVISSEENVFEALLEADHFVTERMGVRCVACPLLTVVAVRASSREYVAPFVSSRAVKGGRLEQIIYRDGSPFWCIYDGEMIFLRKLLLAQWLHFVGDANHRATILNTYVLSVIGDLALRGRLAAVVSCSLVPDPLLMATVAPPSNGRIFPPEILSLIFPDAFGSHIVDFAQYTSNRRWVCLVCRLWCEIIYGTPAAWNHIPICLYAGIRYLDFCLEKAKELPLFLYLNLIPLAALDRLSPHPTRTPAETVTSIFPLFAFGPSKVEEIFIRSTDATSCAAITAQLASMDLTHVRRASLLIAGHARFAIGEERGAPLSATDAAVGLKELRLGYSIPPWPMMAVYANLSTLAICNFRSTTAWEDIRRILRATPRLSVLHLSRVDCRHSIFAGEGTNPVLPLLTDLCVTYTHPSGAEIVSHIEMPALCRLRLDVVRERSAYRPSLEAFVRCCHHHLRMVNYLTIGAMMGSLAEVELFFSCTSRLNRLDLSNASKRLTEDIIFLLLAKAFTLNNLETVWFGTPLAYDRLESILRVLPDASTVISPNPVVDRTFAHQRSVLSASGLDIFEEPDLKVDN